MLTPEYLSRVSEGAQNIAFGLHEEILRRIVERIGIRMKRGENYVLTALDKWQIQSLEEAGYLLEDIQAAIARAAKRQEREIREAMEDAGVKSIAYDDEIFRAAGLVPTDVFKTPYFTRIMQRAYEATYGDWYNLTRTSAGEMYNLFIRACDKAYNLAASGMVGYSQAYIEAINTAVSYDTFVRYPSGHVDTLETATLRCVRTGVSQAAANVTLERTKEMQHDLVITTSHLGARPTHAVWQGKVFHVDWATFDPYTYRGKDEPLPVPKTTSAKYPDFVQSTRYGYVDGLCGANCGHSFSPYFEGMEELVKQYSESENAEAYELQQRQRTLERRIRGSKMDVMAYKAAIDSAPTDEARALVEKQYERKAATLQRQNKEYKAFCEANNLKQLRERLAVAKWDRDKAAEARGAAARYINRRGK